MNQYDNIGEKYTKAKKQPWRTLIEEYTLFKLIKNLKYKKLLDLACGDGHYTKKFYTQNPSKIIGIDISSKMIQLAKISSDENIEYIVGDVSDLNLYERFDVITGIYLLNYAKTESELDKFVKFIKCHLNNDGVFIGINSSMTRNNYDYKKYGFRKEISGDIIKWECYDYKNDLICSFDNYYLSDSVYEKVFAQNNLNLQWIKPKLNPSQIALLDFWNDLLTNSPIVFMVVKHN